MKPTRPYFLRAIYDWILDNQCTPFLAVHADYFGVDVPLEFVEDGQITLNILPSAVADFVMDDEAVSFRARFSGESREIYVPMGAVLGLYAKENGQGMAFPDEAYYEALDEEEELESEAASVLHAVSVDDEQNSPDGGDIPSDDKPKTAAKKPSLSIVK